MSTANRRGEPDSGPRTRRKREFPWARLALAAVPIGLLVYYLTVVGPSMVPVPDSVSVPFPKATEFLEGICVWARENPVKVALIGTALLLPGVLMRFTLSRERYLLFVTVAVGLTLGFVYISISAPIDRLLHAVQDSIPKDNRIPNHGFRK